MAPAIALNYGNNTRACNCTLGYALGLEAINDELLCGVLLERQFGVAV